MLSEKFMKTHLSGRFFSGLAALALAVLPLQAATYITGEIAFTGGVTLNGPLNTATAFSSFFGAFGPGGGGPSVIGANGDYASIPNGTAVTFNPLTFNPAPVSPTQLWSVNVAGTTYSFDLSSISIVFQNANFINIKGAGFAHIDGFDATPGNWNITAGGFEGSPVFTFGSVAAVPEPSTSALLLGAGLVMFACRRIRARI